MVRPLMRILPEANYLLVHLQMVFFFFYLLIGGAWDFILTFISYFYYSGLNHIYRPNTYQERIYIHVSSLLIPR